MKKRVRVLLVDDQELVRQGLRRMLEGEEDMEVVGECTSAEEAFSQAVRLSPDIVLMDVQMPGTDGIEATCHLKRNGLGCDADVILLADNADYLVKALAAGAAGYLNKSVRREELAETIRQVCRSERSPGEPRESFVEEAVELVVPPPAGAAQTLRFVAQMEKRLGASTLQTVGSWNGGTTITILLKPDLLPELTDTLGSIPGVETVEEKAAGKDRFYGLLKRFKAVSRSATGSRKRMLVTLSRAEGETRVATPRLATALN